MKKYKLYIKKLIENKIKKLIEKLIKK